MQGASKKERDGHAHKHSHTHTLTSRSSLVNTATWLRSEDTDLEQWYWYKKEEGFLFSKAFRSVLGLASLLFRGNRGCSGGGGKIFRGKKLTQRQCSAVVKNERSYTCNPSTCLHFVDKGNEVHFIQTDIYVHTHTYIQTYTHICVHTHMHAYIRTYIHTCVFTCMHAYKHTYIIHTYIHTNMNACMHTYIYIYS